MANFTRNIFNGGPCNPDGSSQANAMQQAMNGYLHGNQKLRDQTGFFVQGQEFEQLPPEDIMVQQQNKLMPPQFDLSKQLGQFAPQFQESWEQANQLEQAWQQSRNFEMQRMQEMQMQEAWRSAKMMEQKQFEKAWKEGEQQKQFEQAFQESEKQLQQENQQDQARIKHSSRAILNVLNQQEDPKFKNSQFAHFLNKLNTGELEIKGNELQDNQTKLLQNAWEGRQGDFENVWKNYEQSQQLEKAWQEEQKGQNLEEAWNEQISAEEFISKQMEQAWNSGEDSEQFNEAFAQAWKQANEQFLKQQEKKDYQFAPDNPYSESANPYEIALLKHKERNINETILALEAAIQRNPDNSEF